MNTDPHDQANIKSQDVSSNKILIKHTFLTGSGFLRRNGIEKKPEHSWKNNKVFLIINTAAEGNARYSMLNIWLGWRWGTGLAWVNLLSPVCTRWSPGWSEVTGNLPFSFAEPEFHLSKQCTVVRARFTRAVWKTKALIKSQLCSLVLLCLVR